MLEKTEGEIANWQHKDIDNVKHMTQNENKQNKNTTQKTKKSNAGYLDVLVWINTMTSSYTKSVVTFTSSCLYEARVLFTLFVFVCV